MQVLRKITVKDVGLEPEILTNVVTANPTGDIPVLRVYGILESYEQVSTQFGTGFKFAGQIEAVNLVDNNKFRSKRMIVPETGAEALKSLIDSVTDKNAKIKFGMDITVKMNTSNKGGSKYKFECRPLIDIKAPDGDIVSKIGAEFGALPLYKETKKVK